MTLAHRMLQVSGTDPLSLEDMNGEGSSNGSGMAHTAVGMRCHYMATLKWELGVEHFFSALLRQTLPLVRASD